MTSAPRKLSDELSIDSIGPKEEVPDFTDNARDIQNRVSHQVGSELTEARLFREFFGTSMRVIKILWQLVVCNKLQPRGGHPEHLLWMLYFLKVYPKHGLGCMVPGTSAGAVNPNTHRK
jgi:hypothetical protein